MAKAIPNPEPPWSGGASPRDKAPRMGGGLSSGGAWDELDAPAPAAGESDALVSQLQAENNEYRSIIAELQQELENLSTKSDQNWSDKQKEFDLLIDEKNDKIRELHVRLQELEQLASKPPTPKEEELIAMSEELERERCQLQQERKQLDDELQQLREDSEVMNQEMRQMEVQMARERADLARQRSEIQRLNDEIRHELERVEKDRGLSDRLVQLRQRHMDAVRGKSSLPPTPAATPPPRQQPSGGQQPAEGEGEGKDTGILRRFFR